MNPTGFSPVLVNIFINDLKREVNNKMTQFSDEKLFKGVKMKADPENLLKNLIMLRHWMIAGVWKITPKVQSDRNTFICHG